MWFSRFYKKFSHFFFQVVLLTSWNVRTDVEPGVKLRTGYQGTVVSAWACVPFLNVRLENMILFCCRIGL